MPMLIKVNRIWLSTSKPPSVDEIYVNPNYVKYIEQKDIEKLQLNGWNIPNSFSPLYEVMIDGERNTVYTDEDGYLNLKKGK